MKADHGEPPAWFQDAFGSRKRALKLAQLVVDIEPKCLERPGRRMLRIAGPMAENACGEAGELARPLEARRLPFLDDCRSDCVRAALLAKLVEDAGDFVLLESVHDIGGAEAMTGHAHV